MVGLKMKVKHELEQAERENGARSEAKWRSALFKKSSKTPK